MPAQDLQDNRTQGVILRMKSTKILIATAMALSPTLCLAQGAVRKASTSPTVSHSSRFRLRFSNTDVSDVLQALSLKTRANIVFPSQLKKQISVDFSAANTEDALRFITAASGLTYRLIGKTFVVAQPSELRLALEPFGERVKIALISIKPADAAKMLEDAIPGISARPLINQVLVIGGREDLAQAQNIIADADKGTHVDPVVTVVIPIKNAISSQVVSVLRAIYENLKVDGVGPVGQPGGAVGVSGTTALILKVEETVRGLDIQKVVNDPTRSYKVYNIRHSSAPVLIEFLKEAMPGIAVVQGPETYDPPSAAFKPLSGASLSASGATAAGGGGGGSKASSDASGGSTSTNLVKGERVKMLVLHGIDSELRAAENLLTQVDIPPQQLLVDVKLIDTSPQNAEQIGTQWSFNPLNFFETPPGGIVSIIPPATGTTRPNGLGQVSRLPWSFGASLSAMVSRKEAKILADPSIRMIDNSDANIFIGDTVRTKISSVGNLGTTIQVFEFPIGILLLVHPRVNSDGRITMRIHPVISTITSISNDGVPQTSSREAETTVMMKDGETVMIGGLIRDEFTKSVTEIPLLAKLPIIGNLFRYKSKDRRKSEILVFITPHIVKYDEVPAVVPVFEPEGKEAKKGKKSE